MSWDDLTEFKVCVLPGLTVELTEPARGTPEVRIITDPLDHLQVRPAGSVKLGGVLSAKALRYTFNQ